MDRRLVNETEILHLIYVRSKNQHRTQHWWKYFSILHRRLRQAVAAGRMDPAVQQYLVRKLIPAAARAFHTMLTQGAFITLAFALLAALARVWSILEPQIQRHKPSPYLPRVEAVPQSNEDIGELLAETMFPHDAGLTLGVPVLPKAGKKDKKKKKSKSKNAIDDIFGV